MKEKSNLKKARKPIKSFPATLATLKPKTEERMNSMIRSQTARFSGNRNIDMEEEDKNALDE